ncbi:MAG: LacI family DNA-binding transcriptional regulator [Corynebacterium flavescens]|uniref:LacI family DNA-binding transcriptional regulator n=1 Tax=Corynebacterium flavescens TaxID=28028 RepID=UPI003F92CAFE
MNQKDVALKAGVSPSTVSRYLRGQLPPDSKASEKIKAAMGAMPKERTRGYLRIGIVVPSLSNPYFADIADHTANAIATEGHRMLVVLSGSAQAREEEAIHSLARESKVDGVIYFGSNPENRRLTLLKDLGIPLVLLDEILPADGPLVCRITADNFGGAFQATSRLISLGHSEIAHLGGPVGLHTADERERGYRTALEQNGIEFKESMVIREPFGVDSGANFFASCAQRNINPSAVFCGSDIAAIGLLESARLNSISIPGNLSIIGCDGITATQWTAPRLTTVAQPIKKMAKRAVRALIEMTQGHDIDDLVLPMHLVAGHSVKEFQQ